LISEALLQLDKPIPVEVGDKALLMKLDLPPKQTRVIGLAEIVNLPETAPELHTAKVRQGFVSEKRAQDLYLVSGLFQTKEAAQHVVGNSVITGGSKIKGTIVDAHDEKGTVFVKFEGSPSLQEKVFYYKLRSVRIV